MARKKEAARPVWFYAILTIAALIALVLIVFFGHGTPTGAVSASGLSGIYERCLTESYVYEEVALKGDREVAGKTHSVKKFDWSKARECRRQNWPGKYTQKPDVYDSEFVIVDQSRGYNREIKAQHNTLWE